MKLEEILRNLAVLSIHWVSGVRGEQVGDKGLKWALEGWMTSKSV